MAPKKLKKKKNSTSSSGKQESKNTSDTEAPKKDDYIPESGKIIKINVLKIYNLEQSNSSEISVSVEHLNTVLGSTTVICNGETEIIIGLQTELVCFTTDLQNLNPLIANPVIFRVMETATAEEKNSEKLQESCLGICNLDLLPLFTGENSIEEEIPVEQSKMYTGVEIVTWPNLPRLSVCVAAEQPIFSPEELEENNVLCVTVESVYNALPTMTEFCTYTVGCKWPVYCMLFNDVILEGGKWSNTKNNITYKRWPNLINVEGRAAYSKYRLNSDNTQIKNNLKINLEPFFDADSPRIEWNALQRCMITRQAGCEIFARLSRYGSWPVEMKMSIRKESEKINSRKGLKKAGGKQSETLSSTKNLDGTSSEKKNSGRIVSKEEKTQETDLQVDHFWALFDLTNLLYPGITSVRAAAQLCTFSQEAMDKATGISEAIFSKKFTETESKALEKKKEDEPSKESSIKSVESQIKIEDDAELVHPLMNSEGEPVFMVIQVEFLKPLHPKRSMAQLEKRLVSLIPQVAGIQKQLMTTELAHEHYRTAILTLSEVISTEYMNFIKLDINMKENRNDITNDFIMYLYENGVYQQMKDTLLSKIIVLIREMCIDGIELNSEENMKNQIQKMYVYLVEEMHSVINGHLEGAPYPREESFYFSSAQLLFFALEAEEEGNLKTAQEFYLKRIAAEKKDPQPWLDYAVSCIKDNDIEKAEECVKEALSLDIRSKLGLLIYGILCTHKEDYDIAEMVFDALTCFHPTFIEGWVAFHLFYLKTANCPGADVTLSMAKQCAVESECMKPLHYEGLYVWLPNLYINNSIFLLAAIILLKICAFEEFQAKYFNSWNVAVFFTITVPILYFQFLEMALAQELIYNDSSIPFLYYLSVSHYFQKRYEDALCHLNSAVKEYCMDYCLSSLMAHCYFKLQNMEKAMQYYKFIFESYNRPDDVHLSGLRLGNIYLERNLPLEAKNVYMDVTSSSPSPLSWLGLGISYYMMQEYDQAEAAFCEANILDNKNSTIWAYLTLVNLHFQRPAEFEICYRQLLKLRNVREDLMNQITTMQKELHYPDPTPLLNRQ